MKPRINLKNAEPRIFKAMAYAEKELADFSLDPKLKELIKIRVSQLNGCGYCINMHSKESRALGETEQRLYALAAWWETPFFTDAEQAALKLAEEVTNISDKGLSETAYQKALGLFGEQGVAQLIFTTVTINGWNRIAISSQKVPEPDEQVSKKKHLEMSTPDRLSWI
ncbi:MAG: carboxymuconolactone decarboxylase family protein [Balneolaceae bacterium]